MVLGYPNCLNDVSNAYFVILHFPIRNQFDSLCQWTFCFNLHRKTLHMSRQLKDQAVEAQACYSLGNTHTLLEDYEKAIDYHLKHLSIAQELNDRYKFDYNDY